MRRSLVLLLLLGVAACTEAAPDTPPSCPAELAFGQPGRGASVSFVEYEAESAAFTGKLIGPDRQAKTLAGEASGRAAVTLAGGADQVEFTLVQPANAITVRYSVPDGTESTLTVEAPGLTKELPLTAKYGWFYGGFPFTNEPGDGSAHHFYDHTRGLLGKSLPAGTKVTLKCECTIDLADFEEAAAPAEQPAGSVSVLGFGADPRGVKDSSDAFQAALASPDVWIPAGTFKITRHLIVDRVTLRGAGMWHSILTGDGVGVYGNYNPKPSQAVHLAGFAILGEVTLRDDKAQVNGVGGALGGGSIVEDLFIQHTKAGLWLDGPFTGLTVRRNRIFDTTADGLNLHQGISETMVEHNVVRNTGDDGLAMWSDQNPNHHNVLRNNTVLSPMLANGIGVYGGHDNEIVGNVVADILIEGAGIQVANRFSGTVPLSGVTTIKGNTVLRGGSEFAGIGTNVGAFFIFGRDGAVTGTIKMVENTTLDSSFSGLLLYGVLVTDLQVDRLTVRRPGSVGIQFQAGGAGTIANSEVEGGVFLCQDTLPFALTVTASTGLDTPKCEGI
jgi:hypothetical protein